MQITIDLDKFFEGVKGVIKTAESTEDIDKIMNDASKFLRFCFVFKEEKTDD